MKKFLLATTATAFTLTAAPAAAQLAVVDAANLAEAVDTARNTLSAIEKAQEQIDQAERLYDSVNGVTNISDVASLLDVDGMRGGDLNTDAALDRAMEILEGRPILAVNGSDGIVGAALAGEALETARTRAEGLGELKARLDGATTQREIDEIQARGTIEAAAAMNENNRLASMAAAAQAGAAIRSDMDRETWMAGHDEAISDHNNARRDGAQRGIEAGQDWAITPRGE